MKIIPKSYVGKIAIGLIVLMPVLFFFAGFFANTVYVNSAEYSIIEDILKRPLVALSALLAMVSGVSAFGLSIFALTKQKDRALLIYVPIVIGGLLIFMLLGEFIFPH